MAVPYHSVHLKIGLGKTPKSKSHLLPRNDAMTESGFVDPAIGEANVTALPPTSGVTC